ncbi:MAG: class I SAM-dependent methyltransferase [Actinomycetota bacterium]
MTDHTHGAWTGWKARTYSLLHRNPASSRAVAGWARLRPDMRVLDVGCGAGAAAITAAPLLDEGSVFGIDPSADFVRIAGRRARRLGNVSFRVASAEEMPFPADRFDVAWSVHSTHHWHDLKAGLAEVRRVLRPGGRFLVVERSDADRPWGISPEHAQMLANLLTGLGFVGATVEEQTLGRATEYLITGEVPGPDDDLPSSTD